MRKLFLVVYAALLAAPLEGHEVVWKENPHGTTPSNPMMLYFDSVRARNAYITVQPEANEDCAVMVSGLAVTVGSSAIKVSIGSDPNPTNPGVVVDISVQVTGIFLIGGGAVEAKVSGEWHATGLTREGTLDIFGCSAMMPHNFTVPVTVTEIPQPLPRIPTLAVPRIRSRLQPAR